MLSFRWQFNRIKAYFGRPRLLVQQKFVVLDEQSSCEHPIFITGVHRSGTSLVRRMFNSHPDIACPPESFFIEYYAKMYQEPFVRSGYEGFGFDQEECRIDLMRRASSLHEAYRIGQNKPIWADKTPQYARQLENIDALYAGSPRYVLVYRHPWDIAFSLWKRGWTYTDIPDLFESALVYTRDTLALMRAFEAANPDRCARIVYRQLCEEPEQTLTTAMHKIGLAFHPDMLDYASMDHNWGLEDPVIRGKPTIKISQDGWKNWSPAKLDFARGIIDPADHADIC